MGTSDNTNPAASPPPVDVYVQSKIPADNGYGQNGYRGASSDLPGKRTQTHFLPDGQGAFAKAKSDDWQTRKVSAEPLPSKQDGAKPGATVPTKLSYAGAPRARNVTRE